jgi:PAS domain S-box-containing protein
LEYGFYINDIDKKQNTILNLWDAAPVILMLIGPDTSIRYVNQEFEKQVGFSPKDVIGNNPHIPGLISNLPAMKLTS